MLNIKYMLYWNNLPNHKLGHQGKGQRNKKEVGLGCAIFARNYLEKIIWRNIQLNVIKYTNSFKEQVEL